MMLMMLMAKQGLFFVEGVQTPYQEEYAPDGTTKVYTAEPTG